MTAGLPLMQSVLKPLPKCNLYYYDYQEKCQQQMQLFKQRSMNQELED